MERQFPEGKVSMAKKYIKRCSDSLIIKAMHTLKTTEMLLYIEQDGRYHLGR